MKTARTPLRQGSTVTHREAEQAGTVIHQAIVLQGIAEPARTPAITASAVRFPPVSASPGLKSDEESAQIQVLFKRVRNTPMNRSQLEQTYSVEIGDTLSWTVSGTGDTREWLKKLADMVGFREGSAGKGTHLGFVQSSEKRFEREDAGASCLPAGLRGQSDRGWSIHSLPLVRFWFNQALKRVIGELVKPESSTVETIMMWQALYPIHLQAVQNGAIPLHAALVKRRDWGVLLVGHGGLGKSTCCQRLPNGWEVLCDDESLVVKNSSGGFSAHPLPTWSTLASGDCSRPGRISECVPVRRVFFLEQSGVDEAVPVGSAASAARLIGSAQQVCARFSAGYDPVMQRSMRLQILENACTLAGSVESSILRLSRTGKFWLLLDEERPTR